MVAIAQKAEEVGLDVFATGEHHNPPFVPSSPTTMLGYIAAQDQRLLLSTATTLITTNDPVKIAEDYAMLQHLADGRVDLMLGRGNTGPVYPWFGKDIRDGIELAIENYHLLHRLWREDVVDWDGRVPHAAAGLHLDAAPARRRAAVRLARLDPQPRDRRAGRLLRRRLLRQPHLLADRPHPADGRLYRRRFEHYGHGTRRPGDRRPGRAGVHPAQQPGRGPRVPPVLRQRSGLRARPVAGGLHAQTPLTVGSPQQVIERTLTFREYFGDYQRQLFLVDHAGLPLTTVLEQLDILGEQVVPVLRREFDALRPAHVPDGPDPRVAGWPPPAAAETLASRRTTADGGGGDDPRDRRRRGGPRPALVDPAAGRPARRRPRPRRCGRRARVGSRSSNCASRPRHRRPACSPASRRPAR